MKEIARRDRNKLIVIAVALGALSPAPLAAAADAVDCLAYLAADAEWKKATDLYHEAEVSQDAKKIMFKGIARARWYAENAQGRATAVYKMGRQSAKTTYEKRLWSANAEHNRIIDTHRAEISRAIGQALARERGAYDTWKKTREAKNNNETTEAAVSAAYAAWRQAENDTEALRTKMSGGPIPAAHREVSERRKIAKADYTKALDATRRRHQAEYERINVPWAEAETAAREAYEDAKTQAMAAAKPVLDAARERFEEAYRAAYANPAAGVARDISGYDNEIVLQAAQGERKRCTE